MCSSSNLFAFYLSAFVVCVQAVYVVLVAVADTDRCEPCRGLGGEVCGSVCRPAGGAEHRLGPLETAGRPEPLTGKQQHTLSGRGNRL